MFNSWEHPLNLGLLRITLNFLERLLNPVEVYKWYVLYMICKMNVNALMYLFMHFVGIKLWFPDSTGSEKFWHREDGLQNFDFYFSAWRDSVGKSCLWKNRELWLAQIMVIVEMFHILWTYHVPVYWAFEKQIDSCFPKSYRKMACPNILNPTAEFPWVTEFWNGELHCTMDVACPSMSLEETYCVSKWLPQNRWILKRLAPSWLLFGGISMMLICDLKIKLFIQKMVILM